MFFVCFININKVSAVDAYFVWEKTQIDVPLNSSLENYKNDYKVSFYVDGKKSNDFIVEKEVNCSTFSTVLTNKVGKYTVFYKAKSEKYYVSSIEAIIFNVIDVSKPTIKQNRYVTLECGTELQLDEFFVFSDDTTTKDELKIIINDSQVLYNMVGTYDAEIIVIDKYNNQSNYTFKISIIDNTKPQITILKPLIISYGIDIDLTEYFLAIDNCNGDLTKLIDISKLDIYEIGLQEVIVSVADYSGNLASITVSAKVVDDQPPQLLLKSGEITLDIKDFENYDYDFFKGYIVDLIDNKTPKDELVLEIDYSKIKKEISDYEVIYKVTDSSGLDFKEKLIVKIREMVGPTIIGDDIFTIKVGETLDLLSLVEIYDEFDSNAKSRLEILSSNLNNNVTGSYEVTYICYNSSGNYSTKVIVVNVVEDMVNEEKEDTIEKEEVIGNNNSYITDDSKGDFNFDIFNLDEETLLKVILLLLVIVIVLLLFKKRN